MLYSLHEWRVILPVTLSPFFLFCAQLSCCIAAADSAETKRYQDTNVIMISIDTLRHDHLGCYGYSRNTSDHIDRFAKQSVLFENFVSQAVLTPISQMSIFTSKYPRVNGMVSFQPEIESVTSRTFQEILKSYGYTNAAFIGSPEFVDTRYVNTKSGAKNDQKLFSRAFDYYVPSKGEFRSIPEEALEWVRNHKNTKFFLWLPIGTVHWPYSSSVPAPYKGRFDPEGYVPFFRDVLSEGVGTRARDAVDANVLSYIYRKRFYAASGNPYELSDLDERYIVGRYDAGILYTDVFIGRLLALIDDLDLSKKTLVLIYSTHGEDLGEHGYFGHYDLYDTETKNALLMRFPGNAYAGIKFAPQVQGIDIVPTILEYLNIPIDHEAQGVSQMPEISGNRVGVEERYAYITRMPLFEFVLFKGRRLFNVATRKDEALGNYMQLLERNLGKFDPRFPPYDMAVRTRDWKLILRNNAAMLRDISWWRFVSGKEIPVEELELYDLKLDPMEQTNVVSQHLDLVEALRKKLMDWDASMNGRVVDDRGKTERYLIPYP